MNDPLDEEPTPAIPRPLPRAGPTRRDAVVLVCPRCGSPNVTRRDNGNLEGWHRWECRSCANAWRLPMNLRTARCYMVEGS